MSDFVERVVMDTEPAEPRVYRWTEWDHERGTYDHHLGDAVEYGLYCKQLQLRSQMAKDFERSLYPENYPDDPDKPAWWRVRLAEGFERLAWWAMEQAERCDGRRLID